MTDLTAAIESREWELVALYLLLGVTQAAAQLPPEALDGLLEILDAQAREAGGPGERR
ncbi:MAG: hypothetical protein ACE5KW_05660 [Dehalococcoidia bacterium]